MLLVKNNSFIHTNIKKTCIVNFPQYGFHIKKTEERDTSRAYFSHSADGERSKNTSGLQNFCPLHLRPDAEDYKKDFQIKQHFKKQMC